MTHLGTLARGQGDLEGTEGEGPPDRAVDRQPFISVLLAVRNTPSFVQSFLIGDAYCFRSDTPLIYRAIPA